MSRFRLAAGVVLSLLLIALLGASCSGGGDGGSVPGMCSALCQYLEECESNSFGDEFESLMECRNECVADYHDENQGGGECDGEWLHYSQCVYLAAAEVTSPDVAGPGLVLKTIPALTYASFIHPGNRANLNLTLDYIYQTWLPQSGRRLVYALEIEYFGRSLIDFDDKQTQWEIYIPVM